MWQMAAVTVSIMMAAGVAAAADTMPPALRQALAEVGTCADKAIAELDDGVSPASLVGREAAKECKPEVGAVGRAATKDPDMQGAAAALLVRDDWWTKRVL